MKESTRASLSLWSNVAQRQEHSFLDACGETNESSRKYLRQLIEDYGLLGRKSLHVENHRQMKIPEPTKVDLTNQITTKFLQPKLIKVY